MRYKSGPPKPNTNKKTIRKCLLISDELPENSSYPTKGLLF